MTDTTALNDVATLWVKTLRARGVTVTLRGNRLELRPANAYSALSDAELLTLRHHRAVIKKVVRDTPDAATHEPAPTRGQTTAPHVAPAPCPYCGQVPCIGREHHAYHTLHALDPEEVARRDAEQRARDAHAWTMRQRYGLLSPTWE